MVLGGFGWFQVVSGFLSNECSGVGVVWPFLGCLGHYEVSLECPNVFL